MSTPRSFHGVMVSSTFDDLQDHRRALNDALHKQKLMAVGMENYVVSVDDDVISSSLDMVRDGAAYICLISHRYGSIPKDPRNLNDWSITRMEFEEAQRLQRPTLVFIMSDQHAIKPGDIERDPGKHQKLQDFRVRAKAGRIYVPFDNLQDFTEKAIHAVARLSTYLATNP